MIKLCIFIELLLLNIEKRHFSMKTFSPFHDVTEGPVRVLSMADNRDSAT